MYRNKKVAVSIPCLNEEKFIGKTLQSIPEFIDKIYVTDDFSTDKTASVIKKFTSKNKKIILLRNKKNMGNGFSVVQGFKKALEDKYDIVCILAGDNQYYPEYLSVLIDEVIDNNIDYAKGNRFFYREQLRNMPKFRKLGNLFMSIISKFASGYYSISDPLNSFSAIKISALKKIDIDRISHRYDFENSLLFHFYLTDARIKEIPAPVRYEGEISDINLLTYIPRTSRTLAQSFIKRIYFKYFIYSLHPIALFIFFGLWLWLWGLFYGIYIWTKTLVPDHVPPTTATVMLSVVPFILGFQLLLQGIVLDIQNEPK